MGGSNRSRDLRVYVFFSLSLLFTTVLGHMALANPPPIAHKLNPYNGGVVDYDYSAPLSPSGSNYPCRGHLKYLGTPQGRAVANYSPGGTYQMDFEGGAPHAGGSCQASLSYDRGKTFQVITSIIGGCPLQSVNFKIPNNAPLGEAIFAWTWFNNLGNREMYMNCAVVTIGGGARRSLPEDSKQLEKRQLNTPGIFIANVGNGCTTEHATDVVFPNPGPEVIYLQGGRTANPIGNCDGQTFTGGAPAGDTAGGTGGSGGGGGSGNFGGGAGAGAGGGGGGGDFGGNYPDPGNNWGAPGGGNEGGAGNGFPDNWIGGSKPVPPPREDPSRNVPPENDPATGSPPAEQFPGGVDYGVGGGSEGGYYHPGADDANRKIGDGNTEPGQGNSGCEFYRNMGVNFVCSAGERSFGLGREKAMLILAGSLALGFAMGFHGL